MVSTVTGQITSSSLPPEVIDDVQKRLARIEGQVRGLRRLLDEGAGCKDVIHQVSAANSALSKVGYRLVAAGMQHCVSDPDSPMTVDELERLFMKLG